MTFCKRFIFGRHKDDPKGPAEEHGEVVIEAASLRDARAKFVELHGGQITQVNGAEQITSPDKRFPIVRAEWIGESTAAPAKAKRSRKR